MKKNLLIIFSSWKNCQWMKLITPQPNKNDPLENIERAGRQLLHDFCHIYI